jgi:hypothetical protein
MTSYQYDYNYLSGYPVKPRQEYSVKSDVLVGRYKLFRDTQSIKNAYIRYTTKLQAMNHHDYVKIHVKMFESNKTFTNVVIGQQNNYTVYKIPFNQEFFSIYVQPFLNNRVSNRVTRQSPRKLYLSSKINASVLKPYFNDNDIVSTIFAKSINKLVYSKPSNVVRLNVYTAKCNYLYQNLSPFAVVIPLDYRYNEYYYKLTVNAMKQNQIIINPVFVSGDYYYQHIGTWDNGQLFPESNQVFRYKLLDNTFGENIVLPKLFRGTNIPNKNSKYCLEEHLKCNDVNNGIGKLYGIGEKLAMNYATKGIYFIDDIPEEDLTPTQKNIIQANKNNTVIGESIDILDEDGYYIDIEFFKKRIVTCVIKCNNSVYKYKLKSFDDVGEEELIRRIINRLKPANTIYHWGHVEYTKLLSTCMKYNIEMVPKNCFVDVYLLFKRHQIAIPGAWNYKLKTIAKAMYDLGLIHNFHDDVISGVDLVNQFSKWEYIDFYDNTGSTIEKILKYNYYDVLVLSEIVHYWFN